jgi:hypothetical protein
LLNTASDLLEATRGRPRQANLKRAVSTVYYALFHCLARSGADLMIGSTKAARSEDAWSQVYRALDHATAKKACNNVAVIRMLPQGVQELAAKFRDMQTKRHDADYNPGARFYKSAVQQDIDDTAAVIGAFDRESAKDRRAFAAFVLLKQRG